MNCPLDLHCQHINIFSSVTPSGIILVHPGDVLGSHRKIADSLTSVLSAFVNVLQADQLIDLLNSKGETN